MKFRILLADDDRFIRSGFKKVLEAEGYGVILACNGAEAVDKFVLERADAILLDLMMPKKNGFIACEEIREYDAKVPIIFLSGNDTDANQLRGFGIGADDFIAKDSDKEVILARLKRALERVASKTDNANLKSLALDRFMIGKLDVNLAKAVILAPGGKEIRLNKTDVQLLKALSECRGTAITADELVKKIRGEGFACNENLVYVHLSNLRAKLGSESERLVSARGVGYCLAISNINLR